MIIEQPNHCVEFFDDLRFRKYTTVAVSGYFDPPTPAHLSYFRAAKALGDILIVILNNDDQLLLKRQGTKLESRIRYPFNDRAEIINEFKCVDCVVKSVDVDETIWITLRYVNPTIFAKGGDRTIDTLPREEVKIIQNSGIKLVTNVGCEKTHSSSWYDWE